MKKFVILAAMVVTLVTNATHGENPLANLPEGLELELVYTGEYFENLTGGLDEGGDYRGDISLYATLSTGRLGWWENGEFFVHLQQQHGHGITDDHVGDFQVLSNIEADDFFQLSEFWYKHTLAEGRYWLKLGKQESNADFAYVEYGGEFTNSSAGFSPTIPLVTYPDPDWGAVFGLEASDRFSMNIGVYQGRPDGGRSIGNTLDSLHGPMVMVEPAFHYNSKGKPGHLRFGFWYNGDTFEKLDGSGDEDGTHGFYATWDQLIAKEHPCDDEDEQGIGIFAQVGHSDDEVIEAETYLGGGLQWTGPINGRDDDIAGLGIFHVELSDEAGFDEDSETVLEVFYKAQISPRFSIKPDVQVIWNPGGSDNDTAIVTGLRWELVF